MGLEVYVGSEEDLVDACDEFTHEVFKVLGRPGVKLSPRAFIRAVKDGKRSNICPSSWPTPAWARLIVEQVAFDLSGMQPRLYYNDLPWVEQPAIYTDCFQIVGKAKSVATDWSDERKKDKK